MTLLAAFVVGCASPSVGDQPTGGAMGSCPPPDRRDRSEISIERATMLVGLPESSAEDCAATLEWAFRVSRRDDERFLLTADYVPSRVSVEIDGGIVTSITVG